MEKRVKKIVRTLSFLLGLFSIGVLIGGCSHLREDVVALSITKDCPVYHDNNLLAKVDLIDSKTPTHELQCLLACLRTTSNTSILQSHFPSRICILLAEREDDQETQEKFAAEGVYFAEQAISMGAKEDGRVHYYWAVNMGLAIRRQYALALKTLKPLVEKLESAQQKVPNEELGGPGRVLGMLYLKAPPWPQNVGDYDKAFTLLKQTVEKFPEHPLNHLFYAKALWDINDSDSIEEIRSELEKTREQLKEERWGFAKSIWVKELDEFEKELPLPNS
jgi:tetratricopeptide (TPR) repeat protein